MEGDRPDSKAGVPRKGQGRGDALGCWADRRQSTILARWKRVHNKGAEHHPVSHAGNLVGVDFMNEALFALLGMMVGAGTTAFVLNRYQARRDRRSKEQEAAAQQQLRQEREIWLELVKSHVEQLSRKALSANTEDFLKLAQTRFQNQTEQAEQSLEAKKKLIDGRVEEIDKKLTSLNTLLQQSERQRAEAHGGIKAQLEKATIATNQLQATTGQLREALASSKSRGQWGERMAEDVLRLAGFVENVNYYKQRRLEGGTIPDFTFPLPGKQCVHMDVKFPLDNYIKTLEARDDDARNDAKNQFLRDVRARIKEVTTRDYINPADGTVDYMLVFIPNGQVYGFMHQNDNTLLDDALRNKVVLCSPLTLYAILAVIRQGVDNFRLQESSREILKLLADFKKQWAKYVGATEKMGEKIEAAGKEYRTLTETRTRMLERQLDKIENLQEQQLDNDAGAPSNIPALPADQ